MEFKQIMFLYILNSSILCYPNHCVQIIYQSYIDHIINWSWMLQVWKGCCIQDYHVFEIYSHT